MSNERSKDRSQKFSTKARALLAGGLVLGIGATFTLAAWTDTEWVFGSTGGSDGPGNPGTKIYQMEQNTFTGAAGADAWSDQEAKNGGALTFSVGAKDLKPGATVYAPMQLRAKANSEAVSATLAEGVQATPVQATTNSTALYDALTYQVWLNVDKTACVEGGSRAGATTLVAAGSALTTNSATSIALAAGSSGAPGAAANICFAISLPASVTDITLQGKNTIPLWRFTSITTAIP